MKKTVFVGMSGGVDSSVTAAILKRDGYRVIGVFMKNWTQDMPGFPCTWKDDFQDAKRVAVQLGIEFKVYDFQKDYRQKVVDYMITEYQAGRTPNPDIVCNQEVKFKLFLDTALADGADLIATGHYAKSTAGKLFKAENADKDQTYFLYRVEAKALKRTLFPLGQFKSKQEVRRLATDWGLKTADKKDSQGICFVGKVGIKDFLIQELGEQKPGAVVDDNGKTIGRHQGALFYTVGQRHGLDIGGGLPYYVTGKCVKNNVVYVTTDLNHHNLWKQNLKLVSHHWINECPQPGERLQVRTRHRAPLMDVIFRSSQPSESWNWLQLAEPVRAAAPGQSAVLYKGNEVIGGGVIA